MDTPGYDASYESFTMPDPAEGFHELPDLKRNWPGTVADYRLGREVENWTPLTDVPATAVSA